MQKPFLRRPLSGWEKAGLALLLLLAVGFGVLTEVRTCFLSRRMGDGGCFLRSGWSVKAGGWRLYHVACDNKWHYNYPPLLAVFMTPLADPPERNRVATVVGGVGLALAPGQAALGAATTVAAETTLFDPSTSGGIPYPWSIGILYVSSLLATALAVHLLASALEKSVGEKVGPDCRQWWWLRAVPLLACLAPVAHTLSRGQVNLYLLLLVAGMTAALVRGRSWQAGVWLSGAICLKIFPAYLVIVGLLRRDWRFLAGCSAGLVVGLFLIPAAALGPKQTIACYQDLCNVLIRPALDVGEDTTRSTELTGVTSTDNQAFRAIIHAWMYPDEATRPTEAAPWVSKAHWLLGLAMTGLTVLAGWRWRLEKGPIQAVWMGSLLITMSLTSPVCHTHYFVLCLPLLAGLLALAWERRWGAPGLWALAGVMGLHCVVQIVAHVPDLAPWKHLGMPLSVVLVVWASGCVALLGTRRAAVAARQPLSTAA